MHFARRYRIRIDFGPSNIYDRNAHMIEQYRWSNPPDIVREFCDGVPYGEILSRVKIPIIWCGSERCYSHCRKAHSEKDWEDYQNKVEDALTEANQKIEDFSKKVVEEINSKYELHPDYCLQASSYMPVRSSYSYSSELYKKYQNAQAEREKKIKKTIEEILVELELGGNKETLEKLLKEI